MPHPVSPLPTDGEVIGSSGPNVLCPILDAPYKYLAAHLRDLLEAVGSTSELADVQLQVTSTESELTSMGLIGQERLVALGRLPPAALADAMRAAAVLFFPTTLESFGYPLAEARVNRIPVVAKRTTLTEEVAGDVLVPYEHKSTSSLREALVSALALKPEPLVENPFDPDRYFRRLFVDDGSGS